LLRIGTALVGILIIIAVVEVYFPANTYATPANVTGYSQYMGEGFSLKYPTDWRIQQKDVTGGEFRG
jgi:hypothetical protein